MKEKTSFEKIGARWRLVAGAALFGLAAGLAVSQVGVEAQATSPALPPAEAGVANAGETALTQETGSSVSVEDTPLAGPVEAQQSSTALLQSSLATEDVLERRQGLEILGLRWAMTNVDAAIAALGGIQQPRDRQALIRGIFHFLSGQDQTTALERVLSLDSGDRLTARKELLAAWAPRYSVDSKTNAWILAEYGSGGLGMQLLTMSPPRDELAVLWANSLGPDEGKVRMLAEIAAGFVHRKSPAEALKLGQDLKGDDYVSFLTRFSSAYAERDGKAALEWAMQIADPVLRENLQQSINSSWVRHDGEEVRAYLQTAPAGPARESILRAVASMLAEKDTSMAFTWIQELPTLAEQELAREVVQKVAPIGIGAELRMDGGLPVVTTMLSTGSAFMSQQVQKGDRIVAVDAYGNGFVSTTGLELEQVVKLIRGRPGTSVRLQVSKVNSQGFDAPRVVVLPRLQVLHLPDK